MRLISQNGMIDVPYEQAIIEYEACERNGEEVFYIIFARTTRNAFSIARYSTKAKALKVMEMLREEYLKYLYGAGGEIATRDLHIQPFAFLPPKVFKFPKDEEIEV